MKTVALTYREVLRSKGNVTPLDIYWRLKTLPNGLPMTFQILCGEQACIRAIKVALKVLLKKKKIKVIEGYYHK